jgi:hypothetical protein
LNYPPQAGTGLSRCFQEDRANVSRPASGVRSGNNHPHTSQGLFIGTKTATDTNDLPCRVLARIEN